jgi:hypothetical protein
MVNETKKKFIRKEVNQYNKSKLLLNKNRSIFEINIINLYYYLQIKKISVENYNYQIKKQKEKLALYKRRIFNDYNNAIKKIKEDYIDELEYEIDRIMIVSKLPSELFSQEIDPNELDKFIIEYSKEQKQKQFNNCSDIKNESEDIFDNCSDIKNDSEDIFDTTKW